MHALGCAACAVPLLAAAPPEADAAWRAEFAALSWMLGIDGTVGVRGQRSDAHATFLDIVDSSDQLFGYSGRAEVGYGRLAVYLDGMYDRATDEHATGPLGLADIDVTFEETLLDFGAMYRVAQAGSDTEADIDLYAGGRTVALSLELDPAALPPASGDRSWTDPVVGARILAPIGAGFRLAINGDVGGFGAASDFTWSATALVAWDFEAFGTPASLMLGYRAVGWEYSEGAPAERFTWDIVEHGAILGFALRF